MIFDKLDYEQLKNESDDFSDEMISDLIDMFIKDDRQHIPLTAIMAVASLMFDAVNAEMNYMMKKLNIPESEHEDIEKIVNCMVVYSNVCAVYSALQEICLQTTLTHEQHE